MTEMKYKVSALYFSVEFFYFEFQILLCSLYCHGVHEVLSWWIQFRSEKRPAFEMKVKSTYDYIDSKFNYLKERQ